MNSRPLVYPLLLSSLLAVSHVSAEVYKTVDKQGHVTYTDTPPANSNAKTVDLPTVNNMPSPESSNIPSSESPKAAAEADYHINLTSPTNGTTLMPEERSVTLTAAPNPALAEGMHVAFYIDGQLIEKTDQLSTILNEPPRGEHQLSAAILDADDKPVAQSDAVTLVVMRPILKQKPGNGQGK